MEAELDELLKIDPEISKPGPEKISFADKIKLDYKAGLDNDEEPLLHKCGKKNDVRTAEWLTGQGYPIDRQNSNGENVLHVTCINNKNISFISWVLSFSKGSLLNTTDSRGYSPLLIAINRCQVYVVRCLLSHGADVSVQNNAGANALHMCCCVCEVIGLELLNLIINHINNCKQDLPDSSPHNTLIKNINALDNTDRRPLFYALSLKKDKMAKKLLQHGASPNLKDKYGNTILHSIAKGEASYPIKDLVTVGARVNVRNDQGQTPLHLYIECGKSWDKDVVFLLENGADVTVCDNLGQNALHKAAKQSSFKYTVLFDMLKKAGNAINKLDVNGQTPLHVAIKNYSTTMPYFLKYYSDLSVQDKNGDTALDIAFQKDVSCYKLLEIPEVLTTSKQFRSHCSVDLQNEAGNTLLHYACEMSIKSVFKALLDRGANVNVTNKLGLHPLGKFVCRKFLYKTKWIPEEVEMISLLVKHGSDLNRVFSHNNTSLMHGLLCHLQQPEGYPLYLLQILLILIEYKIDIHLKDQNGLTPIQKLIMFISGSYFKDNYGKFKMQNLRDGIGIILSAGADVLTLPLEHGSSKSCTQFEKYFISKHDNMFVKLLLQFGYTFSQENIEYFNETEFLKEDEQRIAVDWMPSLKCLAGCKIRCSLKQNSWVSVDALDLPQPLKDYIVLFRKYYTELYGLNSHSDLI